MNCEKITYYIEKGHLTKLNISERLQVKLHTMISNCCKNYAPDSDVLNDVLRMIGEEDDKNSDLSTDEKDELKNFLKNLQ